MILNNEQQQAVDTTEGKVLVFAGAGSGKTRVLIARIAHIINLGLAYPNEILAITFTNKATKEMMARLEKEDIETRGMWVHTIHGMCAKILRFDGDKLGYGDNFTIYSETEKDRLLKSIIKEKNISEENALKKIKFHISNAKTLNLDPVQYERQGYLMTKDSYALEVFKVYEESLKKSNALDFDDLLNKAYELLKNHQDVREKYSSRFKYIHVDEFQDTSKVQYEIIKLLMQVHQNIFLVGDDDQSIYSWRGAKIENILNFKDSFADAKIIKLEKNYRSTSSILEVANEIISHNIKRAQKTLTTDSQGGVKPQLQVSYSEKQEASYVASQIKNLIDINGYNCGDFAILYRMNSLSRSFEEAMRDYGLSYAVYGGFKFYERSEIKDVLAYFRVIANPLDSDAFERIINIPKRGIGATTVEKIKSFARERGISFYQGLQRASEFLNPSTSIKISHFAGLVKELESTSKTLSLVDFFKNLVSLTDYMSQFNLSKHEEEQKLKNVEEFAGSLEEFQENNEDATAVSFLNSVTLSSSEEGEEGNQVVLSTVHAAKGLEFRVVFVVGLDQGFFPIIRSDGTDIEEERRLMYVAVTRARERLFLTRSQTRFTFTKEGPTRITTMESEFIGSIAHLVLGGEAEKRQELKIMQERANYFVGKKETQPTSQKGVYNSGYKVGDILIHKKFGEGVVLVVKGENDTEVIEINFPVYGKRTLVSKFAPLTRKN